MPTDIFALPIGFWKRVNPKNIEILDAITEKHRIDLHFGKVVRVDLLDSGGALTKMYIRRSRVLLKSN